MIRSGRWGSKRAQNWVLFAGLAAVFIFAIKETGADPVELVRGMPNLWDYIRSGFPPNFAKILQMGPYLLESFWVATASIFWAVLGSLGLALLAARNVNKNKVTRKLFQSLISAFRSTHPMVYALVFVSAVGLGPFAGVLGLVFHTMGALGRYFTEAFENVDPGVIEAGVAVGARKWQVILYFLIPEAFPYLLGYSFYYFEYCIRQSTMLGLVGAGGIGRPLMTAIRLFKTKDVFAILFLIMAIVVVLDTVVTKIRKRVLGSEGAL